MTDARWATSGIDIEKALIGCVLLDSRYALEVCSRLGLSENDFVHPVHSHAWRCIQDCAKRHGVVDILLIGDSFYATIDNKLYLDDCVDRAVTTAHTEHYAVEVMKNADAHRTRQIALMAAEAPYPDDGFASFREQAIRELSEIDERRSAPEEDLEEAIYKDWTNPESSGIMSRFALVNSILGPQGEGLMIVLAARPSEGKTTIVQNELIHKSVELGLPTYYNSPDTSKKRMVKRLATTLAGLNNHRLSAGFAEVDEIEQGMEAVRKILNAPIYMNGARLSINELTMDVTRHKAKNGIVLAVVDYIQQIREVGRELGKSREDVVGNWSGQLKDCLDKNKIPGYILSQLSRSGNRQSLNSPPPPTLEALRDSGRLEQDADIVWFTYKRPGLPESTTFTLDKDWPMEWAIAKNRDGPTGRIPMVFVRSRGTFMSEHQYEGA